MGRERNVSDAAREAPRSAWWDLRVNAADIRAYKKRWEMVAEIERKELALTSPAQKFADVAMLMGVARALGVSTDGDEEVEQVRRRWVLLAERMGV